MSLSSSMMAEEHFKGPRDYAFALSRAFVTLHFKSQNKKKKNSNFLTPSKTGKRIIIRNIHVNNKRENLRPLGIHVLKHSSDCRFFIRVLVSKRNDNGT